MYLLLERRLFFKQQQQKKQNYLRLIDYKFSISTPGIYRPNLTHGQCLTVVVCMTSP